MSKEKVMYNIERQEKILEIIDKHEVETQEELISHLIAAGVPVTQATVSRDIKELRLVKVSTGGAQTKSKYAANSLRNEIDSRLTDKFKNILSEMVIKINYAGNIVVLKTYSGMAQAACAAIDSLEIPDIVGSLAGDDTIFLVMTTENDASDFVKKLSRSIHH